MPALPPRACMLFAHCFTCSKESKAASFHTADLAEHGVAAVGSRESGRAPASLPEAPEGSDLHRPGGVQRVARVRRLRVPRFRIEPARHPQARPLE